MSHFRLKTKYNSEAAFGSTEELTLYAHHNLSSDYVTFYDDSGDVIMVVPDTINNNILEAIIKLYQPFRNGNKLKQDIEHMTTEDREKCQMISKIKKL